MDIASLLQQMGNVKKPGTDEPLPDVGETIYISSLALLKMLKHGRGGVPLEVMGLMLGSYVDDFTVKVDDVFAMPQSGTGVSVEAVDEVFQQKMIDLLKLTGLNSVVVGWYHSHPGFGPWLSGIDQRTQSNFEKLHPRSVAVVIDPVRSVTGKVVIDAFRLIPQQVMMTNGEARQTTSNVGHIIRPSIIARVHGCGRQYYSMPISFRQNELDEKMLLNLKRKEWTEGFRLTPFDSLEKDNKKTLEDMNKMIDLLNQRLTEENEILKEKKQIDDVDSVGKIDPKKCLGDDVTHAIETNLSQSLGVLLTSVAF